MMLDDPAPTRHGRLLLLFAASISILGALSSRDLWMPDEPRYGRIAYDMERGGDWFVTEWNGEFDAEKPPLGYWIMAVTGRVNGEVNAQAARLACALFAALSVFATAALGRRWFGSRAIGDTAALLFATSGLVLWTGSRAGLDLPLTASVLLAAWAGTAFVERPALLPAIGAGAAVGMGILFKGPHAFYVPLSAIAGGCLASGQARRLRDPRWLAALGVTLLVVAAWLVPTLIRGGEEYRDRLFGQLASRLQGRNEPHIHAFPFLMGVVLICGLPWTPAWIAGLVIAVRPRSVPADQRFGLGAAAGGVLVPLLLLSVAASKREVYLIPLLPCLALLAAWFLHRRGASWFAGGFARWFALSMAGGAVIALASPFLLSRVLRTGPYEAVTSEDFTRGWTPWIIVALGLIMATGAVLAFRRRDVPARAARAAGVALGTAWIGASLFLMPVIDDASGWAQAIEPIRNASKNARLVQLGAPDSKLVWDLRPSKVDLMPLEHADIEAAIPVLFAPGAEPVVAIVGAGRWEAATARQPELKDRATVIWKRRVSHRRWVILVPKK